MYVFRESFNPAIVECKSLTLGANHHDDSSFNPAIVECKYG